MKTFLSLFISILLTTSIFSQSGWQILPSNYTNILNDIVVANDTVAICVGGSSSAGHVVSTLNAGALWTSQSVSTSALNAIGGSSVGMWVVGDGGKIYYTNNGLSWTAQASGTTTDLNDIHFPTSTIGYAVGGSGVIRKTVNASTWSSPIISGGTTYTINAVHFTSATNGVVGGDYNFIQGFINRTTSGATYFGVPSTTISKINDIYFINATTGFAAAESGNIFKTTNSGASWTSVSNTVTSNLNAIHFFDSNYGYIVGDAGMILRTTNGGTAWTQQNSPTIQNLNGVYCLDSNTIYAVGNNGTIIKTTSGGAYLTLSIPDDTIFCNQVDTIVAQANYTGNGTLSYSWSTAPPFPAIINGNTIITMPLTQNDTYICTVTDGTLTAIDTMNIIISALPPDSICLVTVDDSLGHNVVVFEKHVQGSILHYNIYAESSVAGVYDSIGFIPVDSAGIFVDTNSNPAVKAYSYKISTVDSCGNESILSGKHKTMHLTINQGAGTSWNLIWNFYEGIPVTTYRIWRADTSNVWTKIDSVPGTNNSYTDLTPPTGGLYYQVEIISPYICQPYNYKANTNYNSARSNRSNNGMIPASITADFYATPLSGYQPLQVQFTNNSQGNPTNYLWDFGDGDTSTTASPLHTYTTAGLFTVKLVVTTATEIDSLIIVDYIEALPIGISINEPKALIEVYPNPLSKGQKLVVTHKGSTVSEIEIINILGKKMTFNSEVSASKTEISFDDISKGIYFISIIDNNGNITQNKFIVK